MKKKISNYRFNNTNYQRTTDFTHMERESIRWVIKLTRRGEDSEGEDQKKG